MNPGVLYAITAAFAFGAWTIFHQLASEKINNLFGAIIVSLSAVLLGLVFLLPKIKQVNLYSDPKGILFAVFAGICALAVDYFALKAYSSNLAISVVGPIIIGGSVAFAVLIGFFMGEPVTLMKALGLLLVIAGSAILASITG